jgi:hypothetical protein
MDRATRLRFRLFHWRSKCRVRPVRVVITTDSSEINDRGPEQLDLQDTQAITRNNAALQFPVLRGLLSSLSEDESPFSTFGCEVWNARQGSESEPDIFASRIDLIISHRAEELDRAQYEDFASRVARLLEREPGEALRAELQIASAEFPDGRKGLCLRLFLFAHGAGRERAQLRWSLGLARVQQALLFEARAIRQGRL